MNDFETFSSSSSKSLNDPKNLIPAAEHRLAELLADSKIRTVLVMVRHFTMPFGGVKLIAADLVRTFQRAGAKVTLATERSDADMRSLFPEVDDLIVFEHDLRPMMGMSFDLVLTHGWITAGLVLLECQAKFRHLVACSFSSFVPGEVIFGFEDQADALLFESAHNMEAQAASLTHCAAPRFSLRNALATEWFDSVSRSYGSRPERIAIVSNYKTPELMALIPRLSGAGFKVELIGKAGDVRLVDAGLVDSHDLIISIGATVQKAMVRGVPVFCYDHFGGPGYIRMDNLERAEHFNFSGRCSFNRRDAETIYREIVDGYDAVRSQADELCAIARTRYCMPERLAEVIASFSCRREMRSFAGPKYNNLRRLLHLQANNEYPTPVFTGNYMVSADMRPELRMVHVIPSRDPAVAEISVQEKSPFLFMGDQEIQFQFKVLAKLHGDREVPRIFVHEGPKMLEVAEFQAQFRPRFKVTDVRATVSYRVTRETRVFRVIAKLDGSNVELVRVRFDR